MSFLTKGLLAASIHRLLRNAKPFASTPQICNSIHTQQFPNASTSTYEGDGKTKVNILNRETDLGLMINSYSQYGFRLNNELRVVGPMAIFPRYVRFILFISRSEHRTNTI